MGISSVTVPPVLERHAVPDKCPGALRMFEASDGKIARVRLAGSPLTVEQVRAIGQMADALGDGHVLFTTRANVQLRGLDEAAATVFARRVAELGLLPSATHERTRNIVVSPLGGIDSPDLVPLARALDQAVQASPRLVDLAGRFLIGLDDGSGHVAALPLDLAVQARDDRLVLALGSQRGRPTYEVGAWAQPAPVADLLARACETWLDVRADHDERVWNVDDLSRAALDDLHGRVARIAPRADVVLHRAQAQPRLAGQVPDGEGRVALLAKAPLASIATPGWLALADAAEHGAGTVAVTPWHAVVVRGVPQEQARELLDGLAANGWVTEPTSPWLDVHACTGLPHCARSRADVQADARGLVDDLGHAADGLPIMLSGCPRQCGHPSTPHHALVAEGPGSYALLAHDGTHGPQPEPQRERVSPGQARELLAGEC